MPTTDERINALTASVQDLERVTRQGFQVLTELHAETQREMRKMVNAISALADLVADHERRLDEQ